MADFKVAFGSTTSISPAIDRGDIDAGDIVVAKDTHEFIFLTPDGRQIHCKSKTPSFLSMEEALLYAETNPAAYEGEFINIRGEDGTLLPYSLTLGSDGKLAVRDFVAEGQNDFTWQEL